MITTSAVGLSSSDDTIGVFLEGYCCSHRGMMREETREKLECTTRRDKGKGKEFPDT